MELKSENKLGGGLKKLPFDKRDIAFGSLFSLPKLEELPKEFFIPALEIKSQGNSDLCTAFAASAIAEFQDEVILSPYYTFAKGKQLSGDIKGWGLDLRDICKAASKYGFLAKEDDPGNLPRDGALVPKKLDDLASYFKKESYLSVRGQYDLFDDIRATIWANREKKQGVITGCLWRNIWTYANEGIIPKFYLDKEGFGHAFIIAGWKEINGEPYLTAQLSNGLIGDKGYFYFPRSVVNKEFSFGAYVFNDMPAEEAKKQGWSWQIKFAERLKGYFREIFK